MTKIAFADELGIETFEQLRDRLSARELWQPLFSDNEFAEILEKSDRLFKNMTGGPGGILSHHPYFTIHGVVHSRNIIIVLDTMIDELEKNLPEDRQQLTKLEMFCLLLSAYFHDLGMFINLDDEDRQLLKQRQHEDANYTEETYIRDSHHERSYKFVRILPHIVEVLDSFDPNLKEVVAIVSKGHRKDNIDTEEYKAQMLRAKRIRTRLLASLLSLADGLDFAPERAPLELYETYKNSMSEINKAHLFKYKNIVKSVSLGTKRQISSGLTQLDIHVELNVSDRINEVQKTQNDYFTKLVVDSLNQELRRTTRTFQEELVEVSLKVNKSSISFSPSDTEEMTKVCVASLGSQGMPRYTLDMLPDQISKGKWVVMVGNRRKIPDAWTWEDFLVDSSDAQDLYWVFELGLRRDTVILGDSKEEFNKNFFERERRNLLIIGSPGVNLVSKKVNFASFFRFYSQRVTLENEGEFKNQYPLERIKREYSQIEHVIRDLITSWKGSSIIGPLRNEPLPSQISGNEFTGIASLCIHPYCEDRMAVFAAGSRFLGTICAVRKLADSRGLQQHPLGGLVKLTTSTDRRGFDVDNSECGWYTEPYTVEKALDWFKQRLTKTDARNYGYTEEEILRLIQWLYP